MAAQPSTSSTKAAPLRLRLAFPANDVNRRIAVVLDAMWRAIGVRAELQAKEQRALDLQLVRVKAGALASPHGVFHLFPTLGTKTLKLKEPKNG